MKSETTTTHWTFQLIIWLKRCGQLGAEEVDDIQGVMFQEDLPFEVQRQVLDAVVRDGEALVYIHESWESAWNSGGTDDHDRLDVDKMRYYKTAI